MVKVSSASRERLLFAFWGVMFAGVSGKAFLASKQRKNKQLVENSKQASLKHENTKEVKVIKESKTKELKEVLRLLKDKSTIGSACLFSFAMLARLIVSIKVSRKIGKLGSLLAQRKWKELREAQISFAFWTIPGAIMNAFVDYAQKQLSLSIRTQLQKEIHGGYGNVKFSELTQNVKDSDQRATSDLEKLSDDLSILFQSMFKPITETSILTVTLTRLMGGQQIFLCYLYFFLAAMWTRKVTPSFTTSAENVQKSEARYKASHSRLVEYSEQVDFLDGGLTEAVIMDRNLAEVEKQTKLLNIQKFASSSLDGYVVRYMGIMSAIAMMIPSLKVRDSNVGFSVEDPTEYFLTCLHLLVNLMSAFKDVATGFRTLGAIRGLSKRVLELINAFKKRNLTLISQSNDTKAVENKNSSVRYISNNSVRFQDVSIQVPGSTDKLCKDLNFEIETGQSLFIKGPNGVGKTSLFRVLKGIWEPSKGQIGMPSPENCFFLVHKPYFVPGLSLRNQILYPLVNQSGVKIDTRIADALVRVGLFNSPAEVLESKVLEEDWLENKELSAGESQRLACARLLVRAPKFAFIDEGLSCCTENFEEEFLRHCIKDMKVTCLSISHREVSRKLHDKTLFFDKNGHTTITTN